MSDKEGLIRARYAVSVLRVAKGSPEKHALKLVGHLLEEPLNLESDVELNFLRACQQLADALSRGSPTSRSAWDRATAAAAAWLALLEGE